MFSPLNWNILNVYSLPYKMALQIVIVEWHQLGWLNRLNFWVKVGMFLPLPLRIIFCLLKVVVRLLFCEKILFAHRGIG